MVFNEDKDIHASKAIFLFSQTTNEVVLAVGFHPTDANIIITCGKSHIFFWTWSGNSLTKKQGVFGVRIRMLQLHYRTLILSKDKVIMPKGKTENSHCFIVEIRKTKICAVFSFLGKWRCSCWRLRWSHTHMEQNYCRAHTWERA